ncbi:MAG: glycoside hydrolase family 19 protein, partial [Variovorax sp.]
MLSDLQLSQVMRNLSQSKRERYLEPLNDAMQRHHIDTLLRVSAFLAQLAHESAEFQFMQELWGPTDAQNRYEPQSSLARRLGNTEPGDGKRFKGRGPIQITGRFNYKKFGDLLGVDLVTNPEVATKPEIAFDIAGLFWERNGLNELADAGDFKTVTQRINGGQNGAADRERYFARAELVLASSFPSAARPSTAAARRAAARAPATLKRGYEALAEATPKSKKAAAPTARVLDTRRDTLDFRDLMYTPTLIEVPTHVPLGEYLDYNVPILDQGQEGACTGFGLATVANYLLLRRRVLPDNVPVSPRMFYEMARRYDEWPGEDYSGSSARGAMKGWHKHGIAAEAEWPYEVRGGAPAGLTEARTSNARQRPLGAYYRVNHTDLVAMHSAIAEVGALYATSAVHKGWNNVGADGVIEQSSEIIGGHAFAIVAFDDQGFWLQNSWGPSWGRGGFGRIGYDDWLENGTDIWAARLGAPVTLKKIESISAVHATTSAQSVAYSYADLRPHVISVGNNGHLKAGGEYGSAPSELAHIFEEDIPRVLGPWTKKRVLLYAHGGLVSAQAAVQRLAEYRPALLEGEVYPLAFIWRTDYWTSITNLLEDAIRRRRPEGMLDAAKDFMLDRLDDALEPLARSLTGKMVWDEMKRNAIAASSAGGAGALVAAHLKQLAARVPGLEIHMIGHSAGSILHAPLVQALTDQGLDIETCTLWAPACTVDLFKETYAPALQKKKLKRLTVFALADKVELDDHCAHIYNKSLLYLVSNAFEGKCHIPGVRAGVPLLGMQRSFDDGSAQSLELKALFEQLGCELVIAPNDEPLGSVRASSATHHGDFDDDEKTVHSSFSRIAAVSLAARPGSARARSQA